MQQYSVKYIVGFAAIVCLVCSIFVAASAVGLRDKQKENELLDRQRKVLDIAGLASTGSAAAIKQSFAEYIFPELVPLKKGGCKDVDPALHDQAKATKDSARSFSAPSNRAKVRRLPNCATIYVHKFDNNVEMYILPVEGKGLWSTLYGYLAIDADGVTIKGLSFYKHGETPGLGGEVDSTAFKSQWDNKIAYEKNEVVITVKKAGAAAAGSKTEINGLSGATITTNGVHHLVHFWLGPNAFQPFLAKVQEGGMQ